MNQKLGFLCFRGIHNSLPSFWAKLGYSRIKIDHIADSLLKLQIKIGVHLISVELSQLLTLATYYYSKKNIAMHSLSDDHESKSMPEANFQVLVLFKNVTGVTWPDKSLRNSY